MTASLPPQPQRELHPIPPSDAPWSHIGIDLICNMPKNPEGYQHILVAVCYLSKFVVARPLRFKTTKEVLDQLVTIYMTYGVPKSLQHDQGKEFTSRVNIILVYCKEFTIPFFLVRK